MRTKCLPTGRLLSLGMQTEEQVNKIRFWHLEGGRCLKEGVLDETLEQGVSFTVELMNDSLT